jgi:hypothetical protein
MVNHQPSPSEEAVKALNGEVWQAWKVQAERTRSVFRELSAAKLTHEDDPELSATLETCERAVAAFIAAVEVWPEEITMSTMLQQRVRLSLAKAAVLEAMKALLLNISELRDD